MIVKLHLSSKAQTIVFIRYFCYHTTFQDFATELEIEEETYDLIVTNPPFYKDTFITNNEGRNKARYTSSLSFIDLVSGVSKILSKDGLFSVIIPYKEESFFIEMALKKKLFLNRILRIKGTPSSQIKRCLMEFSFKKSEVLEESLIIETSRHQYTDEYIKLTQDFYLKM